jgi:predicted transposase YdaD
MKYDIATKSILDIAKKSLLQRFLGFNLSDIFEIDEIPEETVSLKRSDYPLHIIFKDGQETIVLIEVQTFFNQDFVLRLMDYTVRYMLDYHLEVVPCVLLLTPSLQATGLYKDKRLSFNYEVIRLWKEKAKDFLDDISLCPFIPLMDGGLEILEEAEKKIYENSDIDIESKADLLSAMAIFTGLKDENLASKLLERRRDIMIQSPTYELIKAEGRKEGIQQGIIQGMQELIIKMLELKFDAIPMRLINAINEITDTETLKTLHRHAVKSESIMDFDKKMKIVLEG